MLCATLAARGHTVRWFCSSFDHYRKRIRTQAAGRYTLESGVIIELVEGLGYATNGAPRRLLHNALVARRFTARAEEIATYLEEKPDLILADLPISDSAYAAVRLARQWNVPSVVSIRDLWPDFFVTFLPPLVGLLAKPLIWNLDRIAKVACAGADHLVGISGEYLAWGLKKAGRDRREGDAIIPLGYDPPSGKARANALERLYAKGIDPKKDSAIFIGSWGKTYDLDMLADAASLLQKDENLQFVIAGDGEQGGLFRSRVKGIANIVLPGWLDRDEIAALLENGAVALSPYSASAPQGLPNKLFEYMASGLYQISTLGGEAGRVVGGSGSGAVVSAGDARGFADAISVARSSGIGADRREGIKAYFREHFDAEKVYGKYAALLENYAENFVPTNVADKAKTKQQP
nr:glycosyltransferase family 4 protein [Alteripontixanthobacter muriae]